MSEWLARFADTKVGEIVMDIVELPVLGAYVVGNLLHDAGVPLPRRVVRWLDKSLS